MKRGLLRAFAAFLLFAGLSAASEPRSGGDFDAANRLFADGQYAEALTLYKKTLSTPPDNITAGDINSRIGDTYFRLADYRNALDAYRRAVRDQKPADRPQTQYWIGFCCFLVGRDDEAVTELLKVPALYPDAAVWGSTAYYWAGRASERMGKTEQAAEYYRKAGGNSKSTQGRFARKKAEAAKGK